MAVRRDQFGRVMDKDNKSLQATFKRASAVSSTTRKPDKYDKPSAGDKIILGLLRKKKKIFGSAKSKPITTKRAQDISEQLKRAGVSQETIDRMRGKKK